MLPFPAARQTDCLSRARLLHGGRSTAGPRSLRLATTAEEPFHRQDQAVACHRHPESIPSHSPGAIPTPPPAAAAFRPPDREAAQTASAADRSAASATVPAAPTCRAVAVRPRLAADRSAGVGGGQSAPTSPAVVARHRPVER